MGAFPLNFFSFSFGLFLNDFHVLFSLFEKVEFFFKLYEAPLSLLNDIGGK